jgi:hypothetical protein
MIGMLLRGLMVSSSRVIGHCAGSAPDEYEERMGHCAGTWWTAGSMRRLGAGTGGFFSTCKSNAARHRWLSRTVPLVPEIRVPGRYLVLEGHHWTCQATFISLLGPELIPVVAVRRHRSTECSGPIRKRANPGVSGDRDGHVQPFALCYSGRPSGTLWDIDEEWTPVYHHDCPRASTELHV